MDRNVYIWLLLVIYRRRDKRTLPAQPIDTDESTGVYELRGLASPRRVYVYENRFKIRR